MTLPPHLAPLGLPGAFYSVADGVVVRTLGGPVIDPELSLSVANEMALSAPTEERAALWMAQAADLVSAIREARAATQQKEAA